MDAHQLFKAGRLTDAIASVEAAIRHNPADQRSKTFLFELLCFAGDFDRAEKQLQSIVQQNRRESVLGTLLYKSVVRAEKTRQAMFAQKNLPQPTNEPFTATKIAGRLNGKEFSTICDSDARIGHKLEIFVAGDYLWLSYADIESVRAAPPRRLRDLLWIPAEIKTGPSFGSKDLGEVMIPSMAPLSWQHSDQDVRLGRTSEWCEDESGEVAPYGLKTILVDYEEVPVVDIRELEIYPVSTNAHQS